MPTRVCGTHTLPSCLPAPCLGLEGPSSPGSQTPYYELFCPCCWQTVFKKKKVLFPCDKLCFRIKTIKIRFALSQCVDQKATIICVSEMHK